MTDAPLKVLLKSITFEADRINSFTLQAPDGESLPAFTAGAHIDVHLRPDLVRSYSLTNDPAERQRYVIAVKHELYIDAAKTWDFFRKQLGGAK